MKTYKLTYARTIMFTTYFEAADDDEADDRVGPAGVAGVAGVAAGFSCPSVVVWSPHVTASAGSLTGGSPTPRYWTAPPVPDRAACGGVQRPPMSLIPLIRRTGRTGRAGDVP